MNKVKVAVFPVGGLGTRFLPATKAMPKEMLPVVDKPLIQYAFEEAVNSGIEKFIFITGRNKNIISNHFDHVYELQKTLEDKQKNEVLALTRDWVPEPGSVAFVRQQKPLGLGHAVYCAKNFIGDEPFAVLLADELFKSEIPALKQMIDGYESGNMVGVQEISPEDTGSYGIVDAGDDGEVKTMVEKPSPEDAPSNKAIVGRYILSPDIFDVLQGQKTGAGGEVQLTDAIESMIQSKTAKTKAITLDSERFDCGNRRGFLEANIAFAMADNELSPYMSEILKKYS